MYLCSLDYVIIELISFRFHSSIQIITCIHLRLLNYSSTHVLTPVFTYILIRETLTCILFPSLTYEDGNMSNANMWITSRTLLWGGGGMWRCKYVLAVHTYPRTPAYWAARSHVHMQLLDVHEHTWGVDVNAHGGSLTQAHVDRRTCMHLRRAYKCT